MDAEQQRSLAAGQFLGRGDIGQDHQFLDQTMRVEAFAEIDRLDAPVRGQFDPAFRQVQVQRLPAGARVLEQGISVPQGTDHAVQQRFGLRIRVAVRRRLRLFIGQ